MESTPPARTSAGAPPPIIGTRRPRSPTGTPIVTPRAVRVCQKCGNEVGAETPRMDTPPPVVGDYRVERMSSFSPESVDYDLAEMTLSDEDDNMWRDLPRELRYDFFLVRDRQGRINYFVRHLQAVLDHKEATREPVYSIPSGKRVFFRNLSFADKQRYLLGDAAARAALHRSRFGRQLWQDP